MFFLLLESFGFSQLEIILGFKLAGGLFKTGFKVGVFGAYDGPLGD